MAAGDGAGGGGTNYWRVARWAAAMVLLAIPVVGMQVSEEWNWGIGGFLFAATMIGGAGLLYELAERTSTSLAFRAGSAVALAASFVLVWATIVRDDGTGMGFFLIVMAAGVGGFAARFRAPGLARALLGVAIMQVLLGIAIATAPITNSAPGRPLWELGFSGFFAVLWLVSASLFHAAARADRAR